MNSLLKKGKEFDREREIIKAAGQLPKDRLLWK